MEISNTKIKFINFIRYQVLFRLSYALRNSDYNYSINLLSYTQYVINKVDAAADKIDHPKARCFGIFFTFLHGSIQKNTIW